MRPQHLAAVTLLVCAGAAVAWLLGGDARDGSRDVAPVERSERHAGGPASRSEPAPPRLEGRDAPSRAGGGTRPAAAGLPPPSAQVERRQAGQVQPAGHAPRPSREEEQEAPEPTLHAPPPPRAPLRPARPDWSLGDPGRRDRVTRAALLGGYSLERTLPEEGVVDLEHDDAGGTIVEEIEEPLITAVRGVVVSAMGPVVGAEVVLYSTFYQRHSRYDRHVREVGRTTTDGGGVFDLRPISLDTVHFGSDGELLLTIRRAGFGTIVARRVDRIQPEVENDLGAFTLDEAASSLHGVVLDLKGAPVADAAVRVTGSVNPVRYDKTERMVILKDCPTALTDDEGRYRVTGFESGTQHVSIHVNIDCVLHQELHFSPNGEQEWSPRVLAGGSVRGRVVDPTGAVVAAAVVSGGGNWTPTNADGTFWLDNIADGPFTLHVAHHAWASVYVPDVAAGQDDLEVTFSVPLPRITLFVRDAESLEPLGLVAIDWSWRGGGPPHVFVPESRHWHAADGRYVVIVPEGAVGARVSALDHAAFALTEEALADGTALDVALEAEAQD